MSRHYRNPAEARRDLAFSHDEILRSLTHPVPSDPEVARWAIPMRASWARDMARSCYQAARALHYIPRSGNE